jgi:hypothetical protein
MNFQNVPGQIIILLIGWSFTLFLDHRSKHRAEAIKRKDSIITRLDNIPDWLEKKLEKDHDLTQIETSLAGFVTRIELKIIQLNNHLKVTLIDTNLLSTIRDLDISETAEPSHISHKTRELSSDIAEHIEQKFDQHIFSKNRYSEKLEPTLLHLGSFVFAALIVVALSAIYELTNTPKKITSPVTSHFDPATSSINNSK